MNIDFKVEGLRELDKALNKLPLKARGNIMRNALSKAMEPVKRSAVSLAPIRTGNLRQSIVKRTSTPKGGNGFVAEARVSVTTDGWYGMFHEFGTVKLPARPFIRPAIDNNADAALAIFRRALRESVESR
ncbi:MAG: HK97-gp10 family putative phage morphogenesis protein [Hyphomonadaceae bacterium]